MLRIALTTTVMAALLATGAVAQTAPTTAPATEPTTPPAMTAPTDSTTPAVPAAPGDAAAPHDMNSAAMPDGEWTATDLATISTDRMVGADIVNHQNETIATIDDVLISDANTVEGIVATFGGVLGFGATKVLIQPDEIEVMQDANETLLVRTSLTPEAIESRPAYEG
jgi:glucose/arabinose dehydrogenase